MDTDMANDSDRLPAGWKRMWNRQKQRHYYYNEETSEKAWDLKKYLNLTDMEKIRQILIHGQKMFLFICDTNVYLNDWNFIEFLMEFKKEVGSIFVPKVVMKELDQREKGNVPNITVSEQRKARQANQRIAKYCQTKNFTGEKDHENRRTTIPEPDDTNDDRILKTIKNKPNALFFTNDNNLYAKAALYGMRVSKPCIKEMLKEVLKKHKQAEHTRVNVKVKTLNAKEIAMSRDAEREKRLKNMSQREWEKSKMKVKTKCSEGIFKKDNYDVNDNCKLKHQMIPNKAFLDSLDSSSSPMSMSPTDMLDISDQEMEDTIPTSSYQTETVEYSTGRNNDIVKNTTVHVSSEDITELIKRCTFGLYKIFESEMTLGYGQDWVTILSPAQIDQIRKANTVGIIELYFDKWGPIFRQIRNCRKGNIKERLEDIQKIFIDKKEYKKTDWIFLIKTIFLFFRERHVDVEDELDSIDEVLNAESSAPSVAEVEEEPTPDLIIEIQNIDKSVSKSSGSSRKSSASSSRKSSRDSSSSLKSPATPNSAKSSDSGRNVFNFDSSSTKKTPKDRPSYCVNPMDAISDSDSERIPEDKKWPDSKKEKSSKKYFGDIPIHSNPKDKNVHFLTKSYRTNPLDDIDDGDWDSTNTGSNPMDEIFTQHGKTSSPPPTGSQFESGSGNPYCNPMDAPADTSWNSNCNNNKKKHGKRSSKKSGEAINPDLLSRITSED